MPRKSRQPPIPCQYFTWRLFRRSGVYYADGRGGKYDLGKNSLGTRDREEALANLRRLDRQKAIELGLAVPEEQKPLDSIPIEKGWERFMEDRSGSRVMGSVSEESLRRYKTAQKIHEKFCACRGILDWAQVDVRVMKKLGIRLSETYADRTVYFTLTVVKSVNHLLVKLGFDRQVQVGLPVKQAAGHGDLLLLKRRSEGHGGSLHEGPRTGVARTHRHRTFPHGSTHQRTGWPQVVRY